MVLGCYWGSREERGEWGYVGMVRFCGLERLVRTTVAVGGGARDAYPGALN
jgi:hypothetical protein